MNCAVIRICLKILEENTLSLIHTKRVYLSRYTWTILISLYYTLHYTKKKNLKQSYMIINNRIIDSTSIISKKAVRYKIIKKFPTEQLKST